MGPTYKITYFIKLATNTTDVDSPVKRIAGWSESFLHDNPIGSTGEDWGPGTPLGNLCRARAALLPKSAQIYQQRIQRVFPTGPSQPFTHMYPGASGLACDAPQMALIGRAQSSGTINTREVNFRGLPDARAVEGEYKPSAEFNTALRAFFRELAVGGWKFVGRDLSIAAVPIISVTALGVMKTETPHLLVANDMVRLLRMVNSEGEKIQGGRFKVQAVTAADEVQLVGYDLGAAERGRARKDALALLSFADVFPGVKLAVRKVGRPRDLYSGKRPATTR